MIYEFKIWNYWNMYVNYHFGWACENKKNIFWCLVFKEMTKSFDYSVRPCRILKYYQMHLLFNKSNDFVFLLFHVTIWFGTPEKLGWYFILILATVSKIMNFCFNKVNLKVKYSSSRMPSRCRRYLFFWICIECIMRIRMRRVRMQ